MSEEIEEIKEGVEPRLSRLDQMRPIVEALMDGTKRLSYSSLSAFVDSPKDYADYCLAKKEPTPAMIYGSLLHCLILEPDQFEKRYFTLDDSDICEQIGGAKPRATKKYKEWKFDQVSLAGGRIVVSPADWIHAKIVAANVRSDRAAAPIMKRCPSHETPIEYEFLNFSYKGFIDGMGDTDIFDIKSMPDANREKVKREIWARKLYLQAAMYLHGTGKKRNYHIIAVDKLGGVCCYTLSDRLIEFGMEEWDYFAKRFNYAVVSEAWDQSQSFYADRWDGTFECEKAGWMLNAEF